MRLCLLIVFALVTVLPQGARGEEEAKNWEKKWRRVVIHKALTDEDIAAIKKLKKWPDIKVSLTRDTEAAALASLSKLPELTNLSVNDVPGMTDFSALKPLVNIERLHMHRPLREENVFDASGLTHLTKLREIEFRLGNARLKNAGALKACGDLTKATFTMVHGIDSLDFAAGTPNLEHLDLSGGDHSFPDYKPLAQLKKLKYLNVSNNRQAVDENLAVLSALESLEAFLMHHCKKVTTVDFLVNCTNLKTISAKWTSGLEDISALAGKKKLLFVDIDDTKVTDFSPLAGLPVLTRLNLAGTAITRETLAALAPLPVLADLYLDETKIADLSPLQKFPALKKVNLDKTPVEDLAPLAKLPELQRVSLQQTQVDDLSPLKTCTKLKSVTVSKEVDKAQVEALQEALPKARIRQR